MNTNISLEMLDSLMLDSSNEQIESHELREILAKQFNRKSHFADVDKITI